MLDTIAPKVNEAERQAAEGEAARPERTWSTEVSSSDSIESQLMLERSRLHRLASWRWPIPLLVLVFGLAATATAGFYAARTGRAKDEVRFQTAVDGVVGGITGRLDTYIALLRAGAGLFEANGNQVSAEQFRRFAGRLDLRARYPGMQGLGFAIHVPAERLDGFLRDVRASRPHFRVWPEEPREDYYPIVYLEPEDRRNQAAIGYDMFTEAVRRKAMLAAARTRTAAASGRVTLVQEIDPLRQAGFLIYVPVYDTAAATPDIASVVGFVYSPFRAGDFLSAVFGDGVPEVSLVVYDGDGPAPDRILYQSDPSATQREAELRTTRAIDVAGQRWTVVVGSLPQFEHTAETGLVPWLLGFGTIVTLGLAWATSDEARARAAAESSAERLRLSEEALRGSEARLRDLVEAERHAHAEASAANRAKDDFLATLSHELRTPLNAILGWATMLRSGRLSDQQRSRALEVIARSARTQADLIEDLLDVSRIVSGKMSIEMRETTLAAPIKAAVDAVRPAAEAKGIAIETRLDASPPVLGDPDRLQQVAWNLLSNAIKFTPGGGRVTVSVGRAGADAVLRVADTGMGIEPSFLPHVFERFRQHDSSTTRAHGGMGLGLAIVRHLVEAHGGTVRAESLGPGQGSTFVVTLPLRPAEARPKVSGDARLRARPQGGELTGLRALVVDDDPDARELIAEVLGASGAEVETAASAAEAIVILGDKKVDVLLADIGMPGTDGYGLMQEVRRHESGTVRTVPAIAVTAYAREQDRLSALAAGFQAHLPKPIDVDALRNTVKRLLDA
jgi:signal transduction histidine kinase